MYIFIITIQVQAISALEKCILFRYKN